MKVLIVVDMQVDFTTGSLGAPHEAAIIPKVVEKVKNFDGTVIFTHGQDYLSTQEGRKLPVVHCVKGTPGWEICPELQPFVRTVVDKPSFGSLELPKRLAEMGSVESVELCGLCTDICVISNAMILKAAFPEIPVSVDAACCAGVTVRSHQTALDAMKAVQIEVKD